MDSLLTDFSPEFIFDILSKSNGGDQIALVEKVIVKPAVAVNQNFLSIALRLTISFKTIKGEQKVQSVFVKYGENGKMKAGMEIEKVFFYVESKAYNFLENVYYWAEKNNFNVVRYWPERIHSSIDDNVFMIMLQDLKEANFQMKEGKGIFDKNHIFVAVDRLAKCHAMSRIYLIQQKPDISNWPEPRFDFLKAYHKHGLLALEKAVRQYNENWDYIADHLVNLSDCFFEEYIKCFQSVKDDFPVLSLGDCWANNILFKYTNEKPTDARFIDFQFSYITSFAWDLQYLLYITIPPNIRFANIDELLKLYQQSFSETIIKMGGQSHFSPTLNEMNGIIDKLLLPQFLYSAVSVVEIISATDEDYEKWESEGIGAQISTQWFLDNAIENGFIDNIKYFEEKGLFKKK